MLIKAVANTLDRLGYAVVLGLLSGIECERLTRSLGVVQGPGRRGLLQLPDVATIANSKTIKRLIQPFVEPLPRPVRGVYFNKSPEANWAVSWHRDVTIAVRERADVPDFRAWSIKKGVLHVQPPTELLEQMLTLRIHLDDCDETNGAREVDAATAVAFIASIAEPAASACVAY
jgi:hypothetical protein